MNTKGLIFINVKDPQALSSQSKGVLPRSAQTSSPLLPPSCQLSQGWGEGDGSGDQTAPKGNARADAELQRCCRWKMWLEAPGSTSLGKSSGSPWVGAAHGDSTAGLWGFVHTGEGGRGLSPCSGFAEVCKSSFLLSFLSKTLSL